MKSPTIDADYLDSLIICHRCHALNKKKTIPDGTKALCSNCKTELYRGDTHLVNRGLALSLTGMVFLVLANSFPLIQIEILGNNRFMTLFSMIEGLLESGYYIVALFVAYSIFIFPVMIFVIYALIFGLMKYQQHDAVVSDLLVLLARMTPWHMSDIFLISIMVALVKLLGMAQIKMGTSFWALIAFVLIDIVLTRSIKFGQIWDMKQQIYKKTVHP